MNSKSYKVEYIIIIIPNFCQKMRTRPASGLIEQKPRKMLKLDLIHQK